MASEGGSSSVDAFPPKLLVHEQGFQLPKEEGGGGSDSAVDYVAQRKWSKEKSQGKDASMRKRPKWYNCNNFGHIAQKCIKPERRELKPRQKKGGKPSKGVIEGVAADEWLVESGSSKHLTGDKSLFETLESFEGSGREFTRSGTRHMSRTRISDQENGNCELEVDRKVVLVARKVKGIYVVDRAENAGSPKVVQKGPLSKMERDGAVLEEDACFLVR
ncbi:hypothetical protein KFL_011530010 [Klebsormidium nitens]|uniref:CCHC-type domain-containing protein n=1 Tax=Klebsormidium nitens TaxID=105231 RepID=A0A1Y1IVT2_KLENI|nr:hypothetical protein KFL_011530010 [Klebsormidium nitens]|eukprot:GAQ92817.1 hypothetical protein KFL_011530010 [Klebsormidium nitens]